MIDGMGCSQVSVENIPYMTAAIAVHALLLSLGGLMAMNTLRALAQAQREAWEDHFDAKRRNMSIVDVDGLTAGIYSIKTFLVTLVKINVLVGSVGILLGLLAIVYSPESFVGGRSVAFSLFLVIVQLLIFGFIAWDSMKFVGIWIKKSPQRG